MSGYDISIKKMHYAMSKLCIMFRIGNHHNGGIFSVQFGKQLHYLQAITEIQITGRLIGKNKFWVTYYCPGNGHPKVVEDSAGRGG